MRIGVLGAARIAPTAIIEPARERADVRVISVAARDPSRARAFAEEHGVVGVSASYKELIEREDIDLVYVALPPDGHCRWTIAALEAGKSVLCEKPFALNERQARAMVEAADRSGRLLTEGFHYRFHSMTRNAVALVADGAVGRPLRARASVAYPIQAGALAWSSEHGGGALMDLGCYGIHALRSLLGSEPTVLRAHSRWQGSVDVETQASLSFGEVEAQVLCSMDPSAPASSLLIEGTEGSLEISGFVLPHRNGRASLTRGGIRRELLVDGPSSYAAQLDHVVLAMRGEKAPFTGGGDAIANMSVLDLIKCVSRGSA